MVKQYVIKKNDKVICNHDIKCCPSCGSVRVGHMTKGQSGFNHLDFKGHHILGCDACGQVFTLMCPNAKDGE